MSAAQTQLLNGIDAVAVNGLIEDVARDPRNGKTSFAVRTRWAGGTRSETTVDGYRFAGRWVDRPFTVATDATTRSMSDTRVTSPGTARTRSSSPRLSTAGTKSGPSSPMTVTSAPSARKVRAAAMPIPLVPPVTRTTLPPKRGGR